MAELNSKYILLEHGPKVWIDLLWSFLFLFFLLKELVINSKSSISLQKHNYRSERWTIISGRPKITINRNKFFKKPNETAFIPKGAVHRIENPFKIPVQIVEVQTGPILRETDIIRYKDIYGRVN